MIKTTLEIDGMVCGMCEAHVNDAIRAATKVKKVRSSHKSGQTEILSLDPMDETVLREALERIGYRLTGLREEPYEEKGLFGR